MNIGAEVISPYELWLAEQLSVPGNMILYNGVDKTDESLERAIQMGILSINIDNVEEIDRIYAVAIRLNKPANIGVRLALSNSSQFGLDVDSGEALTACEAIKSRSDRLKFQCIHVHVTSNAKTAHTHKACAVKALEFARAVQDKTGLTASYLDIGGGFGVPTTKNMNGTEYGVYRAFGVLPRPPRLRDSQPVSEFMQEVISVVEEICKKLYLDVPRLLIEPGRLITSRAEFLLANVRAIKRRSNGPIFAITDAGRLSVTFPCDFEYHEVFVADRPKAQMDVCYEVKGRVCTSADWMFKNRCLPELKAGDILAVMDAGAYFSSYSSNFAFPRPAIVMVDDGIASVIRQEETFEHLIAMDAPTDGSPRNVSRAASVNI
jgi:diaminopimelate decarboxylase